MTSRKKKMKKPTHRERVATPSIEKRRLYSECLGAVSRRKQNQKLLDLVNSKGSHGIEQMKAMVKTKVNPVEMRIGIIIFKGLRNGRLQIETHNRNEI